MPHTDFAKVMPMFRADANMPERKPLAPGAWTLCNACGEWFRRGSTTRYSFEFREAVCPQCKAKREAADAV